MMRKIGVFIILLGLVLASCQPECRYVRMKRKAGIKNTRLEKDIMHPKRRH